MTLPVLLFDPNPVAAGVLALQLRRAGFETQMAPDGSTAVLAARGQPFAAIVVVADLADARMRKCLHELRDAEPDAWLVVISDPPVDGARDVVRKMTGFEAVAEHLAAWHKNPNGPWTQPMP
jgi:DNA-binding response OmpR family regulator